METLESEYHFLVFSKLVFSTSQESSSRLLITVNCISVGSDHAGFELKQKLVARLAAMGYDVQDVGTDSPESTDYADYAHPVATRVENGTAERGLLLCGTGLGMSYAANRHPHVRAAVAWTPEIAELARRHNDANILVLPARFLSEHDADQILQTFLATPFEGGRHERRVEKIEPLPETT